MDRLSDRSARTDLTDRECAKLLGACIGGLLSMSDPDTVRRAVRWYAERDDIWQFMGTEQRLFAMGREGGPMGEPPASG